MKLISLLLIVISTLTAQAQTTDSEKIIGDNDLVLVSADGNNIPAEFKPLINAFGIISMGCTATHIGNGYVLTAGHCFSAGATVTKDQACPSITVSWGVRTGATSYLKSNCLKIVAMQRNNVNNDFAIMKVSPVPPVAVGVDFNRKAIAGDVLTIFSHPNMEPLQWSKTCSVETVLNGQLPPQSLQHKCDTNPGSSGATILNATTRRVIGIHDGGLLTSGGDGMNYGTYLTSSEIAAELRALGF
jgi:V8-like Glu-specific endopeptidase